MKRTSAFAFALVLSASAAYAGVHPKRDMTPRTETRDIGGVEMVCSPDAQGKANALHSFKQAGFDKIPLDAQQTKAFLVKFNAEEPATTVKADIITVFRSERASVLTFDIGKTFCIYPSPMPNGALDQLLEDALGERM